MLGVSSTIYMLNRFYFIDHRKVLIVIEICDRTKIESLLISNWGVLQFNFLWKFRNSI